MAEGEDYAGAQGDELDDIDEVPPACLQRQRRARQLFHFQR